MDLQINGRPLAVIPAEMEVVLLDLDDADTTQRTADGVLNRTRIRTIRQVNMTYNAMNWAQISALLKQLRNASFNVTFPDPMEGAYITKLMYVGDRPANVPFLRNGEPYWQGFKITLTEY